MNFKEFEELLENGIKKIVLDSDLKISPKNTDLEYRCEISYNDVVIDGKGHSIDGLNKYGIFLISGENVTLKNIVFKNSFGSAIVNSGRLNIEDCIFKDTSKNNYKIDGRRTEYLYSFGASIGAIYNYSGEINIRNCLFEEEHSRNYHFEYDWATIINYGKINVEKSTFINDTFPNIYSQNDGVNIDSCEFKGEFAEIIHTKNKINIANSQFEDHHMLNENGEYAFLNKNQDYDCLTFKDLKELIDSNLNEIILDSDIYLNKNMYLQVCFSQSKNYDSINPGINIDKNNLTIDGDGNTIYGHGTHKTFHITSDSLILRNINFVGAQIDCECGENIIFENCSFDRQKDDAIVNYANLKLINCNFNGQTEDMIANYSNLKLTNCQFEKHHKIKDQGNLDFESCDNIMIYRDFDYLMKLVMKSITDRSYEVNLDCNIIFDIDDGSEDMTLLDISKKYGLDSTNDDLNIMINGNGHCIFKDSYQSITLEVNNIVFKNIDLINNEGSYLFKVNKSLSIENSNITGFNFKNNGSINLKNCIIDRTTFYNVYGGIKFYDCKFEGYAEKDMISAENGLIDLIDCSFENISLKNNYELEDMGKIIKNENASVNIKDCSFRNINNVILHNINGEVNIENTCFNNVQNKTNHDKPLYTIYNNGNTSIKSSIFEDNFNDEYDGVIYNTGILEIENTKITGENEEIIINRNRISIKNLDIENHSRIITTDDIRISDDRISNSTYIEDNQIVKIKDANYLNNLICNGDEIIKLDNYFYANSITITRDNITIDGCGNTIDADFSGNIFNIEGENITLKNIRFKNTSNSKSGAIHNIGENLSIENCIFENNKSSESGCGISNENGHVKIENTLFKNNGWKIGNEGGAVYNDSGKIDLNNCNFLENEQSGSGGAISNAEGVIFLQNCNFTENMSGNNGGAIYNKKGIINISTSDFKQNKTRYYGYTTYNHGGAIYNQKGEINIERCNFEDNTAGEEGDDIYNNRLMEIKNTDFNGKIGEIIYNNDSLKMESCKINSPHHIINRGTLIYDKNDLKKFITLNNGKTFLKIENNSNNKDFSYLYSLINNQDKKDKIIKLNHDITLKSEEKELYQDGIEINADNIIIDGKNHYIDANFLGSIFTIKNKNIVLKNIKFRRTYSNEYGALNVKNSTLKLENCSFIENSSINGSCIKDERSNIKITNCKFINNSAPNAGAIYCNESKLKLENCKFIDNSAHDGGAIYCNESELKLENCKLEKNHAFVGGSIYFKNSMLDIFNCKFNDNYANNSGGAIAQGQGYNNSTLNINESLFSNNNGYAVETLDLSGNLKTNISNSLFENYKGDGIFGAIRFSQNSDNILKNCNFNYESETIITNHSHLILVNCNLEKHNIARQEAIILDNEDELYKFRNLNNTNISLDENYHTYDEEISGDGLHIDGNMHKIIGTLIITGKNLFFKNIVFTDNIIIKSNGPITFENCDFKSNTDEVIINHAAKLTLKNCNFKKEHEILNTGEVALIKDGEKEVCIEEIIKLNKYEDEADELCSFGLLFK